MSDCRRTAERLTSFADSMLDPHERAEVEQHLEACPSCRRAAALEQGGRLVLRARAPELRTDAVPAELRARCERLARDYGAPAAPDNSWRRWGAWNAGTRPRAPWPRLVPAALTAILIVVTALALLTMGTHRSQTLLATQLTADHVKCFRVFASPDVLGTDARQIEARLSERYGWDVHVPPSSEADGIQLIGARHCLYADGLLPHVMYRAEGQDVSLYMLNGVVRDRSDVVTLGHRSRIWSRGENTYVLVSPAAAGELAAATRYVMREAH